MNGIGPPGSQQNPVFMNGQVGGMRPPTKPAPLGPPGAIRPPSGQIGPPGGQLGPPGGQLGPPNVPRLGGPSTAFKPIGPPQGPPQVGPPRGPPVNGPPRPPNGPMAPPSGPPQAVPGGLPRPSPSPGPLARPQMNGLPGRINGSTGNGSVGSSRDPTPTFPSDPQPATRPPAVGHHSNPHSQAPPVSQPPQPSGPAPSHPPVRSPMPAGPPQVTRPGIPPPFHPTSYSADQQRPPNSLPSQGPHPPHFQGPRHPPPSIPPQPHPRPSIPPSQSFPNLGPSQHSASVGPPTSAINPPGGPPTSAINSDTGGFSKPPIGQMPTNSMGMGQNPPNSSGIGQIPPNPSQPNSTGMTHSFSNPNFSSDPSQASEQPKPISTFNRRYPTQPAYLGGVPPSSSGMPPGTSHAMPPMPPSGAMPPMPPGGAMPPMPPSGAMPPMPPGGAMPSGTSAPTNTYPGMPPMPTGTNAPPSNSHGMPPMPPVSGMPPMPPVSGMPPMPPTNSHGMPPMPPVSSQPGGRFGQNDATAGLDARLGGLSVTNQGWQKMWGQESIDLLQNRHILPPDEVKPPKPRLQAEVWTNMNCHSDIFRSTLTKIPETDALLKKSRLPLGVLIHPFKDLSHLPVIQCTTIVRCRSCRTYINPFVHFVDQRRWRCNLCYRVNELPEEFLYDPVSKSYGDPSRRPECKSSTIEFIAPQEYMLRPPQPAVYLFLLDTSRQALDTGYLRSACDTLSEELEKLPGDARTQVGFITFNRTLQFYLFPESASQATQLVVGDVDDVFLPSPCDLLANLVNCKQQITQMLTELPEMFNGSHETENCLGAALQAAYKMISPTGGRITVMQCVLPNIGPGALQPRETGGKGAAGGADIALLGPATDFYKKLALDCSGQQIAVDLFVMNNQHVDMATITGISKFSGGQVQTFPGYHSHQNPFVAEKFERSFRRYLTRKIGFEAVMRIRCTRGMSLHTFHGHFFVRSTDLLSLPNVNPDTGFGMQVSIEDDLRDSREVSFQAALLYTSSKGERRIRVHTLCIPTSASLQEIIQGADQHCIVGLLAKMAVDRSLNSSLSDAREAYINVCVDTVSRWKMVQSINQPGVLATSNSLCLLPLLVLAVLKSPAFSTRTGVRLDDRSSALIDMKCLPLSTLLQTVYPDLYRVDQLDTVDTTEDEEGVVVANPDRLQLSSEKIALSGAYLMDLGDKYYFFIGKVVHQHFCEKIFGVGRPNEIDENITDLPELDNEDSERLRTFIQWLNSKKSHPVPIRVIRDDTKSRSIFVDMLVDDRSDSTFSYYEFLQHIKTQIK